MNSLASRGVVLLILSRQKAGGGIEMDFELSQALGLDRLLLLSTALILSILDLRFASERNTWEGAVKKSRDWLKANLRSGEPKILEMPLSEWARAYADRKR